MARLPRHTGCSRSAVLPTSLRARLTLALAASLLAGVAVMTWGVPHLLALPAGDAGPGAGALRRGVWTTLAVVVVVANLAALLTVLLSRRFLHDAVHRLRDDVLALASEMEALPAPARRDSRRPTELRPVQDALQETRTRLQDVLTRVRLESDRNRAIIDTVFASLFAVDGGGRIIRANPAAARMFDRPLHALTGVVLSDMIATESLQMSVDEQGTVSFHGSAHEARFTTTFRVFGRRAFPAEVAVTPLVLEGQRAWAVYVHDLTEKHHAEAELQAARQQAEAANRAKTAFLARMSDELRGPLDATIGFTNVVLRSRSSQLSERDRHYLDRVKSASEHLLTLVGDILDLSRVDSGMIVTSSEPTDVTPVVRSIVEEFEYQVAGRPVLLESDIPDDPSLARVDAQRLRQVITNLVSNAVKFTARGSVKVTVCRDRAGDATAVIVRDTGIGIPLERQAKIFDLFSEVDHETSHRYGGTGLGLALAKRLATEMGCQLSVESMPGAGSTFTLAFAPAVPVTPVAARTLLAQPS